VVKFFTPKGEWRFVIARKAMANCLATIPSWLAPTNCSEGKGIRGKRVVYQEEGNATLNATMLEYRLTVDGIKGNLWTQGKLGLGSLNIIL